MEFEIIMNEISTNTSPVQIGTTFVTHMAEQFRGYARKTAESFLEMARVVAETKRHSKDEEFTTFCQLIGHEAKSSTIRKFVTLGAQYPRLIKHVDILPANWTTLYEVGRIAVDVFNAHIGAGAINPALTCAELKRMTPFAQATSMATLAMPVPFGTTAKFQAVFAHKLTAKERSKVKQLMKLLAAIGAEVNIEYVVEQQTTEKRAKKPKMSRREKCSTTSLVEFIELEYVEAFDKSQIAFASSAAPKLAQMDRYVDQKKHGSVASNTLEQHFV